ncbi:MAG: hypothetical protein QHH17_06835 [Candidatus Bathyarchaeota archaeon]|nr:hypothetical protein [Candidatus Bathyarchaeota archaeon]
MTIQTIGGRFKVVDKLGKEYVKKCPKKSLIWGDAHRCQSINVCLGCSEFQGFLSKKEAIIRYPALKKQSYRKTYFIPQYIRCKGIVRRVYVVNNALLRCKVCGERVLESNAIKHAETCDAKKKREDAIRRNLAIIKACPSYMPQLRRGQKPTKLQVRRKNFAIYRLYRYCDMSPEQIANATGKQPWYIQYIIGQVFKELCLKDRACAFKKILTNKTSLAEKRFAETQA